MAAAVEGAAAAEQEAADKVDCALAEWAHAFDSELEGIGDMLAGAEDDRPRLSEVEEIAVVVQLLAGLARRLSPEQQYRQVPSGARLEIWRRKAVVPV